MGQLQSYPLPDSITPSTMEDFLKSSVIGGYIEQHFTKISRNKDPDIQENYENIVNKLIQSIYNKQGIQKIQPFLQDNMISAINSLINKNDDYNNIFSHLDDDINKIVNSENVIQESTVKALFSPKNILHTFSVALQIFNEIEPSIDYADTFIKTLNEEFEDQITPEIFLSLEKHFRQIFSHPKYSSQIISAISNLCQKNNLDYTGYIILLFHLLQNQSLADSILNSIPQSGQDANEMNPQNNLTCRVRLGDNSKILSVCNNNDHIFAIASNTKLYSIDMNGKVVEKLLQSGKLEKGTLSIIGNTACITIPCGATIFTEDMALCFAIQLFDAYISCFYVNSEQLLVLTSHNKLYYCNLNSKTYLGTVDVQNPVCMHYSNGLLTIISKTETLIYEVVPKILFMKLISRKVLDYQEYIVSLDSNYYIALFTHRSYMEFMQIPRQDGPFINPQDFNREIVSMPYQNVFHESLRRIVNLMPVNFFGDAKNSGTMGLTKTLFSYCISILNNLLALTLPAQLSTALLHPILSIIAGIVDNYDITDQEAKTINSLLSSIAISKNASKQSIVLIISYIISKGFEKIYRKRIPDLIQLIKIIASDSTKLTFLTECIPIFLSSPAIVYIDSSCIKKMPEKMKFFVQKRMIYYCAQELENGSEDAITALHSCIPSDLSNVIFFFSIFSSKRMAQYSTIFLEQLFPIIKQLIAQVKTPEFYLSDDDDEPIVRASPHPIRDLLKINWDVEILDAKAIEVSFDPNCCLVLGEKDFFKVSGNNGVVYSRDMYTRGPFPKSVLVNGTKASLTLHSTNGERVYGVTAYFKGIGKQPKQKAFDIMLFYIAYLLHRISLCFCDVFMQSQPDDRMKHCDFLLNSKKLTLLPDGLKHAVNQNVMELLYSENKSHIKINEDDKEIERYAVSAVLNQLEIINNVIKMKTQHKVTPPSTPKKSTRGVQPMASTLSKTMKGFAINKKSPIILPVQVSKKALPSIRQTQPLPMQHAMRTDEIALEEFCSFMMKEVYKLRSKIRYNRQKGVDKSYLVEVLKKSEYFSNCRSVFEEAAATDKIADERKLHCIDLIRLIGSETPLNDIISYANRYIDKLTAQAAVASFLVKFVKEIDKSYLFFYLFTPLFLFMVKNGRMMLKQGVQNNLLKVFGEINALQNNEDLKMLSAMSENAIFGTNSLRVRDLLRTLVLMEKTPQFSLFIQTFCSSISFTNFLEGYEILLQNGFITEALNVMAIFAQEHEIPADHILILTRYASNCKPIELEAFYMFLSQYLSSAGFVNISLDINGKHMILQEFLKLLLKQIGGRVLKKPIEIISKDFPPESHDYTMGIFISFFRTLLRSKIASDIQVTFDNIIFDYSKKGINLLEIIGIFTVVGRGIIPFTVGFLRMDNTNESFKIVNYVENQDFYTIHDKYNNKIEVKAEKCYASARVICESNHFPATKFRANFVMSQLANSHCDPLLRASISVFVYDAVSNPEWLALLSSVSDTKLVNLAIQPTYEGQYHSINELVNSASNMANNSTELTKLVRVSNSLLLGNGVASKQCFMEITYTKGIEMIGFVGSEATNEYQSLAGFSFKDNAYYYNTTKVGTLNECKLEPGQKIAIMRVSKHMVQFLVDGKNMLMQIPLTDKFISPFIVSYVDVDYHIDFSSCEKYATNMKKSENFRFDYTTFDSDDLDSASFEKSIKTNYMFRPPKDSSYLIQINPQPIYAKRKVIFTPNDKKKVVDFTKKGDLFNVIYKGSEYYGMTGKLVSLTEKNKKVEFIDSLHATRNVVDLPHCCFEERTTFVLDLPRSDNIYNAIIIRCLRILAISLQIYDNENSISLIKSVAPQIVSMNYKPNDSRLFNALLVYFENVIKNIPNAAKILFDIDFNGQQEHRSYRTSMFIMKRFLIDDTVKIVYGGYGFDNFKFRSFTNENNTMLKLNDQGYDRFIIEGNKMNVHFSQYNQNIKPGKFAFAPIFKFASDEYYSHNVYSVNLIAALTGLIAKCSLPGDKHYQVLENLYKLYTKYIYVPDETIQTYIVFESYWYLTNNTQFLDYAKPEFSWIGFTSLSQLAQLYISTNNIKPLITRKQLFDFSIVCRMTNYDAESSNDVHVPVNKLDIYLFLSRINAFLKSKSAVSNLSFFSEVKISIPVYEKEWSTKLDGYLAETVGNLNTLPPLPQIELENSGTNEIKEWRSQMIEELNTKILRNKVLQNSSILRPVLRGISHALIPDLKFKIISRAAKQGITEKPTLHFSRTAAALLQTHPDSPHAISLFDQLVEQVSPNLLITLKDRNSPWIVELVGEGAIDLGGPGREIFSEICTEMFLPFNKLFIQTPRTRADNQMCEFIPDPSAPLNRLIYAGALIALSFVTQSPQPLKLDNTVWKFLTGEEISDDEILKMDPVFATSLNGSGQRQCTCIDLFGNKVEMVPNGENVLVEAENYTKLALKFRRGELRGAMKKLRKGFEVIMQQSCRYLLSSHQLKYFVCGPDEITEDQIISKLNFLTIYDNRSMQNFIWTIKNMTAEERSLLLKFVTGRVSIPVSGSGANLSINVHLVELHKTTPPFTLPSSATCSSTITVPAYPTKEIMLERLQKAIREGSDFTLDTQLDATTRTFE